ncbi:hypothetical protein PR048_017221 [Dryococelus australis]|uniref:Uncharacterized protein n=1 Tax=Dryococelus australis TaxID=614101 RepID=A0ABQ9H915_9NEOP|nr:hypothetical protein PR048_017221 [Dryococelus australis]
MADALSCIYDRSEFVVCPNNPENLGVESLCNIIHLILKSFCKNDKLAGRGCGKEYCTMWERRTKVYMWILVMNINVRNNLLNTKVDMCSVDTPMHPWQCMYIDVFGPLYHVPARGTIAN